MKENKNDQSRIRRFLRSPSATIAVFVLAAALLLVSGVGAARAALRYFSETYSSEIEMLDIGVTLIENDKDVSWRNYDSKKADGTWDQATGTLLNGRWNTFDENDKVVEGSEKEFLKIGKAYDEVLQVRNSGTINEFVRVSLYKYWADKDGNKISAPDENDLKTTILNPDLIDLELDEKYVAMDKEAPGEKNWVMDGEASTNERTVLYYRPLLLAEDEGAKVAAGVTDPFTKAIKIDQMVGLVVNQTEDVKEDENGKKLTTITTTYAYDGYSFTIEATVDAVQVHNAEAAVKSAWGQNVSVDGETDSPKQKLTIE